MRFKNIKRLIKEMSAADTCDALSIRPDGDSAVVMADNKVQRIRLTPGVTADHNPCI